MQVGPSLTGVSRGNSCRAEEARRDPLAGRERIPGKAPLAGPLGLREIRHGCRPICAGIAFLLFCTYVNKRTGYDISANSVLVCVFFCFHAPQAALINVAGSQVMKAAKK